MENVSLELTVDTVWIMTCAALIFLMQPGFALLESGMVRSKNAVNVIMKNFVDLCVVTLAFWAIGYGLMFGTNDLGLFGADKFMLSDGSDWEFSVLLFQMMFAATAATIVSGALAERIRYGAYVASSVVISAIIYALYGSWAWGSMDGETEGWLRSLGFIDFAGSTVVHSIGGWCALAGVVALGPRMGRFAPDGNARIIPGHNLPLVALGAFMLWVGWYGFNGGSLLKADGSIGTIILNTHLSGSAGVVGAMVLLGLTGRHILMTSTINAGLGGLVASCAGAQLMDPIASIITGFIAGIIVMKTMDMLESMGADDAVGAVAVHGFAGAWGTLAIGLFHPEGYFDIDRITTQIIGIVTAFLWAFPMAWVTFMLVNIITPLRASSMHEQRGLDFTEHYEVGYPEFQQDMLHKGKG